MKVDFALIGILILACLMITPVIAGEDMTAPPEILTGTLGTGAISQDVYYCGGASTSYGWSYVYFSNIEYSTGLKSVVRFNNATKAAYDNASFTGTSLPFVMTNASNITIATGTIGTQRVFTGAPPVEQTWGYDYLVFDNWTPPPGLTGGTWLRIFYNATDLHLFSVQSAVSAPEDKTGNGLPINNVQFGTGAQGFYGDYYTLYEFPFSNSYTATKPGGIGIQVNITKGGYPSQVRIENGATTTALASDYSVNAIDLNLSVPAEQIKVCLKNSRGVWYNSSVLFNLTSFNITPTQTPIAGAIYTISTNTDYVNVSGTNTVTIASLTDPSLADLKYIGAFMSDTPAGAQSNFYESGSTVHALSYTLAGGTWYGYDSTDVDYNNAKGGIPNPLTLKWDTTSGDKTLHVTLQNSAGDYTLLTRTIHVGQGSQTLIQTRAQAMDGTNGGNLGMVSMQIFNHNSQTWTNLSPNDGLGTIITSPNTILSFYAQKAGFSNGSLLNQPARADLIYSVNLFTGPAVGSGFSNYFVTVKDTGGFPVGGASIKIINSTTNAVYKQATSSTSGGSQIFNLTASTLYTWTVTKNGYGTQSGSFTTPASGGSGYLNVVLTSAVTPTRTAAPIPTGSWTVSPTYGNASTTFWQPWKNVFGMMGANSTELPILIAGIVIIMCMAAGAGMAGVLGAEVAMGFGAILCVALGLIPIWVVLAIIILGFLFYGLKIGR